MNTSDAKPPRARLALGSETVIVRRPHYRLRGDSLFFLISRRPFAVLQQAEQILWQELEQEASVGALEARLGQSANDAIHRLLALEVAEALPPAPLQKRRRVVVIEPHMDDAALSVGGLMWQRRAECEFLIVTMATQSVGTTYRMIDREFFDIATVSNLRQAESAIVARLLWGRHIPLGLIEASLRYHPQNWTLDWFRRHKEAVFASCHHAPVGAELEQWTAALEKSIADLQPAEIWMPLGVGLHVDHQLTRHACLDIMRANPKLAEQCVCRFYQDVPYAGEHREHTAALVKTLVAAGARLEEEPVDITAAMPEKIRLLSHYASQWKTNVIQGRVERCAQALGGPPGRYRELCYRVAAAPTQKIEMLAASAVKESVYRLARELTPWLLRHKSAPTIGLLLGLPVGRWKEDIQFLLDYFPAAHFEVRAQAEFAGETEMFTSPRVSVRVSGNGWRWVLGSALPTVISRRMPLVIASGRRSEKRGRWLACAGLLSDPVVAPTLSDFILALQYAAKDHNGVEFAPFPPGRALG